MNDSAWATPSARVLCLQSAHPLQTTSAVGRWVPELACDNMINTVQNCAVCIATPSEWPTAKFCRSKRARPINNRHSIRKPPGLQGYNGSIGASAVHMSGRLKFKSKSCHGTAARPVKAKPHTVGLRGSRAQRFSSLFFLTALHPLSVACRWPPQTVGYGALGKPANFQRLPRWLMSPWCVPRRQAAAACTTRKPNSYTRLACGLLNGAVLG